MYDYQTSKKEIFTKENQAMFFSIRDKIQKMLAVAGAFRMQEAIANETGNSFVMLACVDWLVEMGEIREVTDKDVAGQRRVFVGKVS